MYSIVVGDTCIFEYKRDRRRFDFDPVFVNNMRFPTSL